MKDSKDNNKEIKDKIDDSMKGLHRGTYGSPPDIKAAYADLEKGMDSSIDRLISRTRSKTGNNMSQLYSRFGERQTRINDVDIGTGIENVFGDPERMEGVMASYMENAHLQQFYADIDTICTYMPSLQESLEVKRDAVLSADVFNKDFMSVTNLTRNDDDEEEEDQFSGKMKELEDTYKIKNMIETDYMNTSKYGEEYTYIIGYEQAFNSLLKARKNRWGTDTGTIDTSLISEQSAYEKGNTVISISEATITVKDDGREPEKISVKPSTLNVDNKKNDKKVSKDIKDDDEVNIDMGGMDIDITLSESNYIPHVLLQDPGFRKYIDAQDDNDHLLEMVMNENHNFYNNEIPYRDSDKLSPVNLSQDGFNVSDDIPDDPKVSMLGCVVRRLKRENVIPIYIDEVCLGYYYIENTEDNIFEKMKNMTNPMENISGNRGVEMEHMQRDQMIKDMSKIISDNIDARFINMNADIANELYTILKYNYIYGDEHGGGSNHIKITFIPPGDMIHFYFEKDPNTHRGISDLQKSLFPAKLYSALYITNTLGILTRSHDKRAYFVKQTVDTNISKLLLNTINQIKKSNFGLREVNNLNNIFNITGRFNDYVIPVSQSGEKPIDFEIIPGQDINENPDLMDRLETMAINPLGVPLELLDVSRSIEFARQITTSNGKFARNVLKRQRVVEDYISELVTKIYGYHFGVDADLESTLSPPSYLTIQNTSEMIANAADMVNAIIEIDVSDDDMSEPWVSEYKKRLMKHHLSSYIDWDEMDVMKLEAQLAVKALTDPEDN